MQTSSLQRRRITGAHAFFLGALLALFALAPAILPYGGRFVTRGDFIEQQLPFILETRRILRGGLNSYSFNTFLGAPAVGSYAFYTLGSVFVWPLALLPKALIPFGISVMAVLKHAVCALTSFCYLRRMIRDERLALLGCVLYAFSGFTVVNTQFYHFTEVIAFFPLILLGMEDAMGERPRRGLLALFCGLNTLTNYYFMLSSALLAALYFVFRFFSADWKPRRTWQNVFALIFECGVGCALAGVLLCPAMLFMLSITRTGAGDTSLLTQTYTLGTLLERVRALLMPIESNVVHAYYGDAPSWASTAAYLPVFGLTGAVALFGQKKHRWLKGLLLALARPIAAVMSTPAEAVSGTVAYLRICFLGVPLITAYNIIASVFRGLGDSKRPMYFIAVACAVNIALDYLFIGALHMGAAGAALGTTLAQAVSVAVSLAVMRSARGGIALTRDDFRPQRAVMGRILRIGVPIALQDGLIQIAFLFITVIANRRGLTDAAAVGIVEKIISFLFLVPSSMLSTVSALGAQCIGAGKPRRALQTLWYAIAVAFGFGVLISVVIQFVAEPVVALFTHDAAVVAAGGPYLRGYILDCCFAGVHFCFSGYFCAIGRSELSFVHNITAVVLVRVPGAYLTSRYFPATLLPMGLATAAGSLLSVIICVIAFLVLRRHGKLLPGEG